MTLFLILLNLFFAWCIFYVVWGRTWLKTIPAFEPFYRWIEPIEIALWDKSETILWSRLLMLLGAVPFVLDQLSMFNIPQVIALLPPQVANYAPLVFVVLGIVSELLRRTTTKPLSMVALPDDLSKVSPKVAEAVIAAGEAKFEAVDAIEKAA